MLNIVSRSLSVHKEHEVLLKLEAAGFGDPEAQAVIESQGNVLAKKTIAYIRQGGYEEAVISGVAREIMGKNFLGMGEVTEHFGVKFTDVQAALLRTIPFPEKVLEARKENYILFAGYPLSVKDIYFGPSRDYRDLFYSEREFWPPRWCGNHPFATKKKVEQRWYLIRKDMVPDSTNKTYQEQVVLLAEDEEVPRVCEVVYMAALYFLATGDLLLEKNWRRCRDKSKDSDARGCAYAMFGSTIALDFWHDIPYDDHGIAASCLPAGWSRGTD